MKLNTNKQTLGLFAAVAFLLLIAIYIPLSKTVYKFRHPEQTSTQLFLHTWDALTWK